MSNNSHSVDIKRRLALGLASFKALMPIWKQNRISVKLKLFSSIIIPIAKYGSKTWTIRVDDSRRLATFETKLLSRIACITYVDGFSNADLLKRLQHNTPILNRARIQQFKWLGHVQRMYNDQLPKIAFEGRIQSSRPPKRWKKNFSDCNLPGVLILAKKNREQYRRQIYSLVRREALRRTTRPGWT